VKTSWQYVLDHVGDLAQSEFSKIVDVRVKRRAPVIAAKTVGEELHIFPKDVPAYVFYPANTWVWLAYDGSITLRRDEGEAPGTRFVFRLKVPSKASPG
jgi:hypothetical protein